MACLIINLDNIFRFTPMCQTYSRYSRPSLRFGIFPDRKSILHKINFVRRKSKFFGNIHERHMLIGNEVTRTTFSRVIIGSIFIPNNFKSLHKCSITWSEIPYNSFNKMFCLTSKPKRGMLPCFHVLMKYSRRIRSCAAC